MFNLDDHVAFYLNIGLLFPIAYELEGEQLPKNPKEYDCQFRIRTNTLTGRNQAYDIYPHTNMDGLRNLIESDVRDVVIPFFNRYETIEDCLLFAEECPNATPVQPHIGLTLIKKGNIALGNKIIDDFVPTTHEKWANKIEAYKRKIMQTVK